MSTKNKIKVGIVGASGYTGGELLRLLVHHKSVEIVFAYSTTNNGKLVSDVYSELIDEINIEFTNTIKESDVIFLCQGHGKSYDFLLTSSINQKTKIIDLSQDFRLETSFSNSKNSRNFTYGLPELQKEHDDLTALSQAPDFWNDQQNAQNITKKIISQRVIVESNQLKYEGSKILYEANRVDVNDLIDSQASLDQSINTMNQLEIDLKNISLSNNV